MFRSHTDKDGVRHAAVSIPVHEGVCVQVTINVDVRGDHH